MQTSKVIGTTGCRWARATVKQLVLVAAVVLTACGGGGGSSGGVSSGGTAGGSTVDLPAPAPAPGPVALAQRDYFLLHSGDFWTYTDSATGATEVVRVTGTRTVAGQTGTVVSDSDSSGSTSESVFVVDAGGLHQ